MIYATFACSGLAIVISGVQVYYVNQIRKLRREREKREARSLTLGA